MNVILAAKNQVRAEAYANEGFQHSPQSKKRGVQLVDGELQWIGEYADQNDAKPYKLSGGDKQLMTGAEQRLFLRTPFERGMMEYNYDGELRVVRHATDPRDPRHSYREGTGRLLYPSGEQYEGAWKMNKRQGDGYWKSPRGYCYTGEWANDTMHGKGHETFAAKASIDAQTFEHGLPEGVAVMIFSNGTNYRYEGEFLQGRRHGKGSVFYENGDVFVGTWDGGKRHGRGVTTTRARGKEMQYETEWEDDVMIAEPFIIEKSRRTKKPRSAVKYSTAGLAPADLTKWKVKEDATELPMEHFLRIKLGFELMDTNAGGSLSHNELSALWGTGSQEMLKKLDADGNGTVELDEIFGAWYPNVPSHNIARFMQLDINPRQLLRLRGMLAGVRDEHEDGYLHVTHGVSAAKQMTGDEDDKPLLQKHLDQTNYKIGAAKFTMAMFTAAKVLCDPPFFLEVLESWYPNIPRMTLQRYELQDIPADELDLIQSTFLALSGGQAELDVAAFQAAEERWRESGCSLDEMASPSAVEAGLSEGFFKGFPFWVMGSIRVSVVLLQEIDASTDNKGGIDLRQLLRYCFPNVKCKRTQEHLQNRRKMGMTSCACQICEIV
jgi:Ca2+-binding EF-hand superfamily protein